VPRYVPSPTAPSANLRMTAAAAITQGLYTATL